MWARFRNFSLGRVKGKNKKGWMLTKKFEDKQNKFKKKKKTSILICRGNGGGDVRLDTHHNCRKSNSEVCGAKLILKFSFTQIWSDYKIININRFNSITYYNNNLNSESSNKTSTFIYKCLYNFKGWTTPHPNALGTGSNAIFYQLFTNVNWPTDYE